MNINHDNIGRFAAKAGGVNSSSLKKYAGYSGTDVKNKLNADEDGAINTYVEGSDVFNATLRDNKKLSMHFKPLVESLDSAIANSTVKSDTTVYRVVGEDIYRKLKSGDVFSDSGYVSTTTSRTAADDIKEGRTGNGVFDRIVEINIPKGFPGLDINKTVGPHPYSHEKELLLPRGLSFKVLKTGKGIILTYVQ